MIDIDALEFTYPAGRFRLGIPKLAVSGGEKVAVVGPSGTGKTTLLNLIAGLIRPEAGRIEVDGRDLSTLDDDALRRLRAARIGFVFQNFALLDYLSARDNILYPYRISPALTLDRAARDRAEALGAAVGLGGKLDRRPGALSQGEQQRVAICRALVTEPRLILSDEATGNLDPANKDLILDLIFDRAAELGAAIIAVTHDHALLPRFDRVVDFADYAAEIA